MSRKKIFPHTPQGNKPQASPAQNGKQQKSPTKTPPVLVIKGIALFCQDCKNPIVGGTIFRLTIDTIPHGDFCSPICCKRWAVSNGFRMT